MPNLALISNFEATMIAFSCLFLLVISTINTVTTISSLASKHFYSFAHSPYCTRSMSIVAYHNNTHCPHHLHHKSLYCLPYFYAWVVVSPPLLPSGVQVPLTVPQFHLRTMRRATASSYSIICHSCYNVQQYYL